MDKLPQEPSEQIAALRQERETLVRQIKQCQETIERSRELIERIDALLANLDGEK